MYIDGPKNCSQQKISGQSQAIKKTADLWIISPFTSQEIDFNTKVFYKGVTAMQLYRNVLFQSSMKKPKHIKFTKKHLILIFLELCFMWQKMLMHGLSVGRRWFINISSLRVICINDVHAYIVMHIFFLLKPEIIFTELL